MDLLSSIKFMVASSQDIIVIIGACLINVEFELCLYFKVILCTFSCSSIGIMSTDVCRPRFLLTAFFYFKDHFWGLKFYQTVPKNWILSKTLNFISFV